MYELIYMPSAEKFFKKTKDAGLISKFNEALDEISGDPYKAGKAKTGDLLGIYCRNVFYGKTNYEVAYRIIESDCQYAVVILAGTRENFYAQLKRYMNS